MQHQHDVMTEDVEEAQRLLEGVKGGVTQV